MCYVWRIVLFVYLFIYYFLQRKLGGNKSLESTKVLILQNESDRREPVAQRGEAKLQLWTCSTLFFSPDINIYYYV